MTTICEMCIQACIYAYLQSSNSEASAYLVSVASNDQSYFNSTQDRVYIKYIVGFTSSILLPGFDFTVKTNMNI